MSVPSAMHSAEGMLLLDWPDGSVSRLSHARLRSACPCAQCRAARLQGRIDLGDADVRLRQINHQGYGVQLVFSDGHGRGIYPWRYLFELT